jgi:hypothetical protein
LDASCRLISSAISSTVNGDSNSNGNGDGDGDGDGNGDAIVEGMYISSISN